MPNAANLSPCKAHRKLLTETINCKLSDRVEESLANDPSQAWDLSQPRSKSITTLRCGEMLPGDLCRVGALGEPLYLVVCVTTEKIVAASSVIVGAGRSVLDERPRCDVRHNWRGSVNDI